MRILVHGLAGDKLGGIETFILNMEKFMSDDMVFDYVLETVPEKNSYVQGKGEIDYIAPKHSMPVNLRDWNRLLTGKKGIDEAVYFNMYSLAWLLPAMLCRLRGYRVIIHAHNNQLHDCGFAQKALHNINRQIQKCMKITRLTNSELSTEFFFDNKPATMIYNAVDTDRFSFDPEARHSLRVKLGFEDKNVYGFSGRIAYQKNPLFLIDIFAEIAKLDDKAAFLVCGDGDLMEKVQAKAKERKLNICFPGAVKNVQDYYQAMDCFFLPSRFEGLGIVLIEAQCAGLPCLTSADVVPKTAQVSEKLLKFVPLSESPEVWAQKAAERLKTNFDRSKGSEYVRRAGFDITKEALRLENVLLCGIEEKNNE